MKENNIFKSKEISKADQFNKNASNLFRKFTINNIRSKNCIVLVAEEKSILIGYLAAQIKDNIGIYKVKKLGYISDLFVRRNHRKRKISSALKKFAIEWFKSKNIKYIYLKTEIKNNLGRKIYRKWGFFEHHLILYKRI